MKWCAPRSADRTTSKQSLTQPTLLERGFLNIYPCGSVLIQCYPPPRLLRWSKQAMWNLNKLGWIVAFWTAGLSACTLPCSAQGTSCICDILPMTCNRELRKAPFRSSKGRRRLHSAVMRVPACKAKTLAAGFPARDDYTFPVANGARRD